MQTALVRCDLRGAPRAKFSRGVRAWLLMSLVLYGTICGSVVNAEDAAKPAERSSKETAAPPADLETRFRQLEESHRRLLQRFDEAFQEEDGWTRAVTGTPAEASEPQKFQLVQAVQDANELFDDQPPDVRTDEPAPVFPEQPRDLQGVFFEGFKWETKDGEYTLNFHSEMQLDTRMYAQAHSNPVNQFGFYIPRMRMIFNGRLTKPIEYNVSINKGLGDLDLLDAYFNFNYDSRVQFRIGRYRVPFTYDWFALSNQFLMTPERSVFALNQGYNRNFAAMVHGEIWDEKMEYAVALANGPRNSYYDTNSSKDLLVFVNARPFEQIESLAPLKNLNLGGSLAWGMQDQEPLPVDFRTSANATESTGTLKGVSTFLELNDDVREQGVRQLWELHLAYYYKQLSLLGAYDAGFNTYLQTRTQNVVRVPTQAFHVQFGYFLTGEEIDRRTFVKPLKPFDLRAGRRGPGAFEVQARFDHFALGNDLFTGELADPNLWTNRVNTIDTGVNWYLNTYTKIYFDWQHAMYGSNVLFSPTGLTRHNDLFWIRFQYYF